ncbi:MAG: RluA family pseudouridine synthase [Phycisphaeraceae bacterium]
MNQRWTHHNEIQRLDLLLVQRLDVTRGDAKRAIEAGHVLINQHVARRNAEQIEPGTMIEITGPIATADQRILPEPDAPLYILAHGDGWIAVNKPSGQPVHPLVWNETGTTLNAAVARYPTIQDIGEAGLRSGVVHRLDVGTTGVLLIATNSRAWRRLRNKFADRLLLKRYLALVEGKLDGEGNVRMCLSIHQHNPARVQARPPSQHLKYQPDGRMCDLYFRSLCKNESASLIEIDLGTGFLHQIRAMMAANGHPVLGDTHYNASLPAPRPMLHAKRIEFDGHIIEAPIPDDFAIAMSTHNLTASP